MFSGRVSQNYTAQFTQVLPNGNSPYVHIYNINEASVGTGTVFVKQANPSSLPATGSQYATGANFDPAGMVVGITISASPWITFYDRVGNVFTKQAAPSVLPNNIATRGGYWHPKGQLWSQASSSYPYIYNYTRIGTTMTNLSSSTTFYNNLVPTAAGYSTTWNPAGTILSVGLSASPWIANFWYDGTTFYRLGAPNTNPTGRVDNLRYNIQGTVLSLSHDNSPFMTNYWVNYNGSATTFTKLANPTNLPATGTQGAISWNNTGSSVVKSSGATPYVHVYNVSYNGTLTTFTRASILPAAVGTAFSAEWLPDDKSFIYNSYSSPYFAWYTRDGDTFTKQANLPDVSPIGNPNGPGGISPRY